MDISGVSGVGRATPKEYIPKDRQERYIKLLEELEALLNKETYTEEDALLLSKKLAELKELQKEGLLPEMNDGLNILFTYFENNWNAKEGKYIFDPPSKIQGLKEGILNINGKDYKVKDILAMILVDAKDPDASKTMGDLILSFSKWGFKLYADKVKALQKQVDAATKIIDNLAALQEILNEIMAKYPETFEMPPKYLSDIPKEIQDLLESKYGKDIKDKYKGDMLAWAQANPESYTNVCDTYFKQELGVTADFKNPDSIIRLLNVRDEIFKQLQILKESGGATGEGTPIDTLEKVLATIDANFKPVDFPYPTKDQETPTNWEAIINDVNSVPHVNLHKAMSDWIMSGNTAGGKTGKAVDKALQANQTLSSALSDDLKEKNLFLTTLYEMLTSMARSWHGIIQSSARGTGKQ